MDFLKGKNMYHVLSVFVIMASITSFVHTSTKKENNDEVKVSENSTTDPLGMVKEKIQEMSVPTKALSATTILLLAVPVGFRTFSELSGGSSSSRSADGSFAARVSEAAAEMRKSMEYGVPPSPTSSVVSSGSSLADFRERVANAASDLRAQSSSIIPDSSAMTADSVVPSASADLAAQASQEIRNFISSD